MKAIETRIYGCRFRSRLEARWAVAFTEAKIEWEYEPEGFDLDGVGPYLPDFWLPQESIWCEVKPGRPSGAELEKAEELACQTGHPCLLLIGKPQNLAYWAIEPHRKENWEAPRMITAHANDYMPFCQCNPFYVCTGFGLESFPMPHDSLGYASQLHPAIDAALCARFEHGEAKRYRR